MTRMNLGVRPRGYSLTTRRQHGFTMIEVLMSIVLLGISAALAIPSYQDMVEKRQLTNAAEQLSAFINATQGISSRTNQPVTLSFSRDGHNNWCIGATMGEDACDCEETEADESDYCEIDSQPYVLDQDISSGKDLMHSISPLGPYSFDPIRGLFSEIDGFLTIEMHSKSRDFRLNLLVNETGRVLLCSKNAADAIPGYDVCPVTVPVPIIEVGIGVEK